MAQAILFLPVTPILIKLIYYSILIWRHLVIKKKEHKKLVFFFQYFTPSFLKLMLNIQFELVSFQIPVLIYSNYTS